MPVSPFTDTRLLVSPFTGTTLLVSPLTCTILPAGTCHLMPLLVIMVSIRTPLVWVPPEMTLGCRHTFILRCMLAPAFLGNISAHQGCLGVLGLSRVAIRTPMVTRVLVSIRAPMITGRPAPLTPRLVSLPGPGQPVACRIRCLALVLLPRLLATLCRPLGARDTRYQSLLLCHGRMGLSHCLPPRGSAQDC